MAIRQIVQEGDPILSKTCRPVTQFDERLAQLFDDMKETLAKAGGLGLAGPQVGMLRRVFICMENCEATAEEVEALQDGPSYIEFVNPEILTEEGEVTLYEGCLSFPGQHGEITRPEKVTARAFDRNGNPFTIEAHGMLARCICHENNHLNGITIMDLAEDFYNEDEDEGEE